MDLYICEKPSQGKDLSRILGCNVRKDGYQEGSGKIVTWCMGHLLELLEPDEYDARYKKWTLPDLPIVPKSYRYKVKKSAAHQYKVIQELVKKAGLICISTDYDREGEAIARLLLDRFHYHGPVKRLCLTALDDNSIRRALSSVKEGYETEPLYQAALGRSYADWLVGMNLSRLFTIQASRKGKRITIQIGRVITPTVALVVQRDEEINNFKPVPYYELWIEASTAKGPLKAKWVVPENKQNPDGLCVNRPYAEEVALKVQDQNGIITRAEHRQVKEAPPLPFDLTSLQQYASRRWGYTAQETLQAAQSLYEKHKATTYPRTDCRYLPQSQLPDHDRIFDALAQANPELREHISLASQCNFQPRCFNTAKVEAHHGIIPTMSPARLEKMNTRERNIFLAVSCYYLIQFCPDAVFSKSVVDLESQGEKFHASGKVLIHPGYRQVLQNCGLSGGGKEPEKKEDEEEGCSHIPPVATGDQVTAIKPEIKDKMTTPPAHFTEATLLDAMEHISRFVSDERFKKILRETAGIGTPATRASIIESALHYDYLERSKKWLLSTTKARSIMPLLPGGLKSPGLTAAWEQELDKIAHRESELSVFMTNIEKWIRSIIMKYQDPATFCLNEDYINSCQTSQETCQCFNCGEPLKRIKGSRGYFWACHNPQCKATFNDHKGKPLPRREIPAPSQDSPVCPKCGAPMILRTAGKTGNKFWGCSKYPECKTTITFEGTAANENAPRCPECGKPMKLRTAGTTGNQFWGCTGYPACRRTMDYKSDKKSVDPDAPVCPKCGSPMVKRTSKKTGNSFWGCSKFPACDGAVFS